jgi:hypothetical protein
MIGVLLAVAATVAGFPISAGIRYFTARPTDKPSGVAAVRQSVQSGGITINSSGGSFANGGSTFICTANGGCTLTINPDAEFKQVLRSSMPYELEGDGEARAAFRKWVEALSDQRAREAYIEALDEMAGEEARAAAAEQEAKAKREAILASFPRAVCRHRAISREDSMSRGQYECNTVVPKEAVR